jgi:hypothetical protein
MSITDQMAEGNVGAQHRLRYIDPYDMPGDLTVMWPSVSDPNDVWFALMLSSFYIELEMPAPLDVSAHGSLLTNSPQFSVCDVDIWSEPPIREMLDTMARHHLEGSIPNGHYAATAKYLARRKHPVKHQADIEAYAARLVAAERLGRDEVRKFLESPFDIGSKN